MYLLGDASDSGFGSALIGPLGILYESGAWRREWTEESSNFREADNLVRRIERLVADGTIRGQEIFLFTDNMVFEGTFYKGHSSTSEKLSEIIL